MFGLIADRVLFLLQIQARGMFLIETNSPMDQQIDAVSYTGIHIPAYFITVANSYLFIRTGLTIISCAVKS